ncbi:MAG: methyltransferase [Proteobacteria bacterium]|nr:methyltransferase [Pseudomonadota bacterium]
MDIAAGALGRLLEQYRTEVNEVRIGRTSLKVLDVDPSDETLQRQEAAGLEGRGELPYWTRIWPATMVLAKVLLERPSRPGERLLELGAGRGLVGLFAATAGYRVTISDVSALALDFSRATAELNDLEDVDFQVVDWTAPGIMPRFDVIVGSEILYLKSQFPAMVAFLKSHLEPGGEVYLSHGRWPVSREFFAYLGGDFETKGREVRLRGRDGEDIRVALHLVRPVKPGPQPN